MPDPTKFTLPSARASGDYYGEPTDAGGGFVISSYMSAAEAASAPRMTAAEALGAAHGLYTDPDYAFANFNPSSYDTNGFLQSEISISMQLVKPEDYGYLSEALGPYGVGIWVNLINPDGFGESTLDDPLEQEYRIYSALTSFSSLFPMKYEVDTDKIYVVSAEIKYAFEVSYSTSEKFGFIEKYPMLPDLTVDMENRNTIAQNHIEQKYSDMAADIYQTMLSREYVPNIIKNNNELDDIDFSVSLGTEAPPELTIAVSSGITTKTSGY